MARISETLEIVAASNAAAILLPLASSGRFQLVSIAAILAGFDAQKLP
jgi:hypothetical protein